MKHILIIPAIGFASAILGLYRMEGAEFPQGLQHDLESHLSYGDSAEKVTNHLNASGLRNFIIQPLGLSPQSLREMGEDVPEDSEKYFEKFSIRVGNKPLIVLGFDSNDRLISYTKLVHADKRLFGFRIADAFGEPPSAVNTRQQVRPTSGDGLGVESKRTPNGITLGEAIEKITGNLKFGDTVNEAIQIFKNCGVLAKPQRLTLMTEDELSKFGSDLSEEEKAAFYYEIHLEAELGVRLSFDFHKRLVQFQFIWRTDSNTTRKTIGKVEESRRAELIKMNVGGGSNSQPPANGQGPSAGSGESTNNSNSAPDGPPKVQPPKATLRPPVTVPKPSKTP